MKLQSVEGVRPAGVSGHQEVQSFRRTYSLLFPLQGFVGVGGQTLRPLIPETFTYPQENICKDPKSS